MARIYNLSALCDIELKCTALEFSGSLQSAPSLYIGDAKGFITVFKLVKVERGRDSLVQTQTMFRPAKVKVDRLKADRRINVLFVLSENALFALHIETLALLQKWDKSVVIFCLNEHPEYSGNVAFATKKKVQKYQLSPNSAGREIFGPVPDDLAVPDTPAAMAWFEESLCLGFMRRPFMIVHSGTGTTIKEIQCTMGPAFLPYVKVVEDMFYCSWSNNLLVPIYSRNGENANKSPLSFSESKKFIGISYQSQFIIAVSETLVEVFNYSDHSNMQREPLLPDSAILALADTSTPLLIASIRQVLVMRPIPWKDQIHNLLQECRVSEAQMVLESNISLDDEGLITREKFNLDAAWCLFRKLSFTKSVDYFILTNFDPRDFISLYKDFANDGMYINGTKVETAASIVQNMFNTEADPKVSSQDLKQNIAERIVQCKLCVMQLLKERRTTIFKPPRAAQNTETINFLHSEYSYNKIVQVPLTRQETLQLIDNFLFKMYVDMGLNEGSAMKLREKFGKTYILLLEELLDPAYKPHLNLEECMTFLGSWREQTMKVQAMVYEYFDMKEQALGIWRQLGSSRDVQERENAGRQTAKILMRCTDRTFVLQNVVWVLKSFPVLGLDVFTSPKESHHISYDNVLELLKNENTSENCLVERYLRWLIEEKQVETERFHTRLAKCYIDALFQLRPAKESLDSLVSPQGKQFQEYKRLLLKFLETSRFYRTSLVYDEIEGSWLIEAKVLLLCRDRNYDDALRIQVQQAAIADNFGEVEQFCMRQGEGLLTKLLKLYITKVEDAERALSSCSEMEAGQLRYDKEKYQKLCYGLLQKYANHSELDVLQVIDMIPSSWPLNNTQKDSLYSYLYVALSHTLHEVRNTMITKAISDMDALNVECEANKYKGASVRITQERLCPVCNKKIGDRPFAVYPNGKTVHQQCVASPSVCPVTNTNFETQL